MGALLALAAILPQPAISSPALYLVPVGESRVYRLERPITRVAVGNSEVADYIMLNPSELYLLGKNPGTTNLILWDQNGNFTSAPLNVNRNINPIKVLLKALLPNETDIQIFSSGPALVLSGSVSNTLVAETVYRLVTACLGGTVPGVNPESSLAKSSSAPGAEVPVPSSAESSSLVAVSKTAVAKSASTASSALESMTSASIPGLVNLLKVRDPQQVRLEVRIAEISRSCIERLGLSWTYNSQGILPTGFVSNAMLNLFFQSDKTTVGIEAERNPGLIKILAEPTIVAMSGQEGYFLVGGKFYTPTISSLGVTEYVERTYGVGLRFTPTVLDGGRISLKVTPEVSEPVTQPVVTGGSTSNFPAFKTSTVSTTVQMNEGENLVIGGLLRDKLTEIIRAVPLLGNIPLLGTLFRRTDMSSDTTELLVIIRPTLVKGSSTAPELPTDRFVPPTRKELFIDGKLQGSRVK